MHGQLQGELKWPKRSLFIREKFDISLHTAQTSDDFESVCCACDAAQNTCCMGSPYLAVVSILHVANEQMRSDAWPAFIAFHESI